MWGDELARAGDPRGELVATQCALAAAGVERVEDLIDLDVDATELARLAGMQRRVQQLLAEHREVWLAPLALPEGVVAGFRRGMPEAFSLPETVDQVTVLERVRAHTSITELELVIPEDDEQTVRALARMALPLRSLTLSGVGARRDLDSLLAAAPGLTRLGLRWSGLTDLTALASHRGLRELDLAGNRTLSARALGAFTDLVPDVSLRLVDCQLDDKKLGAILDRVARPRGLDVRQNPISVKALRSIVLLPSLRHLGYDPGRDLAHDKRTVGTAIAKAAAPLRSLALGGSVNGPGLAAIAASHLGASVRAIDLRNDRPGDIGAEGNAALAKFTQIVHLRLRNESTEVGVALIAKRPTLAYFNSGRFIIQRATHAKLAAHFGDAVPPYREASTYSRAYDRTRQIVVPDRAKFKPADLGRTLHALAGLVVEWKHPDLIVRDPKVVADPIRISMKKLPNQPRYVTLAYRSDDEKAWAKRLDELVAKITAAIRA